MRVSLCRRSRTTGAVTRKCIASGRVGLPRSGDCAVPLVPKNSRGLSEGQHPESGAQLVKHQPAKTYDERVRQGNHQRRTSRRVGCDILRAKSVSLTALVGGDRAGTCGAP